MATFRNAGRRWRPQGVPEGVKVHDFIIPTQRKKIPHGVYDLTRDEGWVSVGVDHDTASFERLPPLPIARRTVRQPSLQTNQGLLVLETIPP